MVGRVVLITAFGLSLFACGSSPETRILPAKPLKPVEPVILNIKAVGDMMLGTNYPFNHLADDDGKSLLEPVSSILGNADITFGNLEGSLIAEGKPRKECKDPKRCYLFRSPPHYAQYFKQAGFDVLSLANNHAQDFGEEGARESMRHLDSAGIRHTGQEGDIASWEVKGLKVTFIAYAPFIGSHDFLNTEQAQRQIQQLAELNDIIVVSMHAGGEGMDAVHVPFAEEYFYGENRGDVAAFSRAMIDAGADLVIGHGPHVPRGVELYKDRLIAYSLGNFCTYYGISVAKTKGLAPILDVKLDNQGRFLNGSIISARQVRPGGPVPDKTHAAARLIKRLSEADFPSSALKISEQGRIYRTSPLYD